MEIISEPQPKKITVTDIDIRFPGEAQQITLFPGDESRDLDDGIEFRFAGNGEVLTVNLTHALWVSRRQREIIIPEAPDAPPPHKVPSQDR